MAVFEVGVAIVVEDDTLIPPLLAVPPDAYGPPHSLEAPTGACEHVLSSARSALAALVPHGSPHTVPRGQAQIRGNAHTNTASTVRLCINSTRTQA